jgi:hypothetical protein
MMDDGLFVCPFELCEDCNKNYEEILTRARRRVCPIFL